MGRTWRPHTAQDNLVGVAARILIWRKNTTFQIPPLILQHKPAVHVLVFASKRNNIQFFAAKSTCARCFVTSLDGANFILTFILFLCYVILSYTQYHVRQTQFKNKVCTVKLSQETTSTRYVKKPSSWWVCEGTRFDWSCKQWGVSYTPEISPFAAHSPTFSCCSLYCHRQHFLPLSR